MNETELLFTNLLNCDRASLYLNKDLRLDRSKSSVIAGALKRRINGEPIQYIIGKTEFMGLEFIVTPDVLIPRPETEILVETVLNQLSAFSCQHSALNILDLGTGSGCIAVSLAKFLANAHVDAIDISEEALSVAKQNAALNSVEINLFLGDLFIPAYCLLPTAYYDLIIANPPYISTVEIETLQAEIQYEPRVALDGGKDGLDFYRRIIGVSCAYIKGNGLLIMEIGFDQAEPIKNIFKNSNKFEIIEIVKDYNGIDRVIVGRKNG